MCVTGISRLGDGYLQNGRPFVVMLVNIYLIMANNYATGNVKYFVQIRLNNHLLFAIV